MLRQFSFGNRFVPNEDCDWIRSIVDVADKDSRKPHVREFISHPTRENYKAWMKGEKIRHLEPGEKPAAPVTVDKKMVHELARKRYERRSIGEIR